MTPQASKTYDEIYAKRTVPNIHSLSNRGTRPVKQNIICNISNTLDVYLFHHGSYGNHHKNLS